MEFTLNGLIHHFKLKLDGCVQITSGISNFEIINLDNGETVGGNVTHLEPARKAAIKFAHSPN